MLSLGFFDEPDDRVDDILIDHILYIVLRPVKSKEAHSLDSTIILAVPPCAVDDMRDLVEGQPLYVLSGMRGTWAMTSSPMKMLSVILTGMEMSSRLGLLSLDCMGLIYDCYIINLEYALQYKSKYIRNIIKCYGSTRRKDGRREQKNPERSKLRSLFWDSPQTWILPPHWVIPSLFRPLSELSTQLSAQNPSLSSVYTHF